MKNGLVILTGAVVLVVSAWFSSVWALDISSAQSGNWDETATWVGGQVPGAADNVTILDTHTVTITGTAQKHINSLTIASGGVLTHPGSNTEEHRIDILIDNNLLVEGDIDVAGRGYLHKTGPGAGAIQRGANHGGVGYGNTNQPTYGSIREPIACGSACHGCPGGGAVRLTVGNATTVNGTINANAKWMGATRYGGGAGGSVWLTTGTLSGAGVISVNGTHAEYAWSYYGAGGGGGRVAVYLTGSEAIDGVAVTAYGGWHPTEGGYWPGCGTIYLQSPSQPDGAGTLILDNGGNPLTATMAAIVGEQVTECDVGDVIILPGARFVVTTNAALTVRGSWSNGSSFEAHTDSTVRFTGNEPAVVYNDNTFYNLFIGAPGRKPLSFEAGSTQTVLGDLSIDYAQLGSVENGSWWYLVLDEATGSQTLLRTAFVRDSNASGGQTITAMPVSLDQGNNVNWVFISPQGTIMISF